MMMPAAVLFDLDGTLIDTTDLILASCQHTFARHLKAGCPPREALIATFGRSLPESLLEIAVGEGAEDPAAFAADMLATYRAHNDEHHDALIRPFDGVEPMLASLRASGVRLGVVTSKRERSARLGMSRYRLGDFFEIGIFHDDTRRRYWPERNGSALRTNVRSTSGTACTMSRRAALPACGRLRLRGDRFRGPTSTPPAPTMWPTRRTTWCCW